MSKMRKDIVNDLLKEAGYYWYDDDSDNVNPIDLEQFDPVIGNIFKATALELEKLYAELDESRRKIVLNLAQTLVPDQALLPEPGYTVAQIQPKSSRVEIYPTDKFIISGQSDIGQQYDYYFTSLFEHSYPKCELKAIVTEHSAFKVDKNIPELVLNQNPEEKTTRGIWLGLEIGKVKDYDKISFFLGNTVKDEFDKNYHHFKAGTWKILAKDELSLSVETGVNNFFNLIEQGDAFNLLDVLDISNNYEKQIRSRFQDSFQILSVPKDISKYKTPIPPSQETNELFQALGIKEALLWIFIDLSLPIPDNYLQLNRFYPNCIPLVNRRLLERNAVKSNYDRILLSMPTEDLFLDIHKVKDTAQKEGESYQQVNFLEPINRPGTYLLRGGSSIRRFNKEDASSQIQRILEVVYDEYSTFKEEGVNSLNEDFKTIEQAINRIKGNLPGFFREEKAHSSYFCITHFRPKISRLEYFYWETQGDEIRHLGEKTGLAVSSGDVKIADSTSVIPIQRGKGELSADDFINQLKISLLSGGKILTKADIALYCKSRFGHLLKVEHISREIMMVEQDKLGRGIMVRASLNKPLSKEEMDNLRVELQNDLNARSGFFTSIRVEIKYGA